MKTKKSLEGFVFMTVLVFLQIFSLLGLFQLTNTSIVTRSHIRDWQMLELLIKIHSLMKTLEENINPDSICFIPNISAVELAHKSISWWRQHTCHGILYQIRYYYAIESLGVDTCGVVSENIDNHRYIAQFYRLTLFVLANKKSDAILRLQSTIATAIDSIDVCHGSIHQVIPGRQMWRELVI